MAIVCRSLHRWWIPSVIIAASMLATADASSREIAGIDACALQNCMGPWADRFAVSNTGDGRSAVGRSDGVDDRVPGRFGADGARSDDLSTIRTGRSSRLGFDAEDTEDRTDGDDDTDVPVRAWFRDMVRATDAIPASSDARSGLIDTPSVSSPSYQPLRC